MEDHNNTRELLINELRELKQRVAELKTDKALRESEQMMKSILAASPVAIVCTHGGIIKWVNHAWVEMFGYENEQKYLHQSGSIMHPSKVEYEHVHSALHDNVNQGEVEETDAMLKKRDGSVFDAHIRISLLDQGDPVKGTIAAISDITGRKRQEQELQNTLQRFYTTLSSSYSGLLLVTNEGTVEFINQAMCDLFDIEDPPNSLQGLSAPEMIGKLKDVYAQPEEIVARIGGIVAQNRPVKGEEVAIRGGRTYLVDYTPIEIDGKPYGHLWAHTDITDLKRTQEALRTSNERFELVIMGINDGIWDWNIVTGDDFFSERWCELLGYTLDELAPHYETWVSLLHPDDRERVLERVQRHLEKHVPYDLEYRLWTKAGYYRWFHVKGQAIWDESGKPLRMAGSISEMTERNRIELKKIW